MPPVSKAFSCGLSRDRLASQLDFFRAISTGRKFNQFGLGHIQFQCIVQCKLFNDFTLLLQVSNRVAGGANIVRVGSRTNGEPIHGEAQLTSVEMV